MSTRLDALLTVATIADVLRLAHIEPPSNERKPIICPLHAERTPSFRVQQSGRGYRCHGCNAHGGIIELAVALGLGKDKGTAVDRLSEHFRIPESSDVQTYRNHRKRPATYVLPPIAPEPSADADALARVSAALRDREPLANSPGATYLASRGIDPGAADAHDTRYHANWLGRGPAIVFAIRDRAGNLVAAQGRFIDPKTQPKAMTVGALSAGVYRTAAALDVDIVAITEAPLDALAIAVSGLPAIALCGVSLASWLRSALAFRTIVVATDNDAAGESAADRIGKEFNLGTTIRRLVLPVGIKDANELLRTDSDDLYSRVQAMRELCLAVDVA